MFYFDSFDCQIQPEELAGAEAYEWYHSLEAEECLPDIGEPLYCDEELPF